MSDRRSLWVPVLAGAVGGGLAGAGDGLATLWRGVGGISGMHSVRLLMIAVGLAGVAGALLAAIVHWLVGFASARARSLSVAVVTVVLAAPVIGYDAFAAFSGPRAAKVPAHLALSVVLLLVGLTAIALLTRFFERTLAAADAGSHLRRWGATVFLLLLAVGCYWTNRNVLPRLYLWFHVTLSLVFLVSAVLAARFALGGGRAERHFSDRARALVALGLVVSLVLVEIPSLLGSTIIRYAAHERTQLTGLLIRALPIFPRIGSAPRLARQPVVPEEPLPEGPHRPNADVILITIDALRADHVGAYGYHRATTPNIDALAKDGVRFERAYTQAPHTSFSVASMLTGKYYPTIARLAPGDSHDPIAEVLRRYGWKTAAFYPPAVFYVDGRKLKAYQDSNFSFEYVKFEYLDAFKRLDQIDTFFKTEKPGKAFLWLHLFEPHEPYDERDAYSFGKSDVDRYDSEIAYTDAAVGKLVAYLQKRRPGAIIIITADHGEEFDEHDGRYHGTSLFEEQVRVPLIMVVPGVKPHVVSGPVELIDIAPTILGLVDIPTPARMRGTDLGAWLGTPAAPDARLPPAFAEVAEKRMIVWGMDKLICEMNWGYCAYYDLTNDPHEKKNAAEQKPERAALLKQRLDEWLDDHLRYEPQLVRGLANPEGGAVPKAIERGRLGDLMVVGELAAMLQSRAPLSVRREAARLLVSLPPRPETREKVLAALSAEDEDIRRWALVAGARLGDATSQAKLKELLAQPATANDQDLRVEAALALAHIKDPTGVPVLAASLDDCEEKILFCQLVILKLGALRDRRAVPALLKHLPEVQNRREMVQALGAIGDRSVADTLVERLKTDDYVPVRAEAALALGRIGGSEAEAGLAWSLKREHEPSVVAAARTALAHLAQEEAAAKEAASKSAASPGKTHSPRKAAGR